MCVAGLYGEDKRTFFKKGKVVIYYIYFVLQLCFHTLRREVSFISSSNIEKNTFTDHKFKSISSQRFSIKKNTFKTLLFLVAG